MPVQQPTKMRGLSGPDPGKPQQPHLPPPRSLSVTARHIVISSNNFRSPILSLKASVGHMPRAAHRSSGSVYLWRWEPTRTWPPPWRWAVTAGRHRAAARAAGAGRAGGVRPGGVPAGQPVGRNLPRALNAIRGTRAAGSGTGDWPRTRRRAPAAGWSPWTWTRLS
jgi:hypothetical protein